MYPLSCRKDWRAETCPPVRESFEPSVILTVSGVHVGMVSILRAEVTEKRETDSNKERERDAVMEIFIVYV